MTSPSLSLILMLVAAFLVPAEGREINLGRVSVGSGQILRPLPPPSEGWLVIMQRFDFSVNFNRNWTEYRNGFGELGLQKEFWLGNEAIHLLTTRFAHELRIEVLSDGVLFYADYESFSIDSEANNYTLRISGYRGNAGDSLTSKTVKDGWNHDGASFSTPDADNDNATSNCAERNKAGWWFDACWDACLTCPDVDFSWKSLSYLLSDGILKGARMRVMRK